MVDDAPAKEAAARGRRSHLDLGKRGEDLAADYLQDQGIAVMSRNWRRREGELDLVATDGQRLIVCEVKTRSGRGYGLPSEAVTPLKQSRIRRLAYQWLSENHVGFCTIRFDVIAIEWPPDASAHLAHFKAAF